MADFSKSKIEEKGNISYSVWNAIRDTKSLLQTMKQKTEFFGQI